MMNRLRRNQAEKAKKEYSSLSPELKFEKLTFYLLILFLPTQFGKHFWPSFSQVLGIRVDYLSPTLYLTDIIILVLFIFWLGRKNYRHFRSRLKLAGINIIILLSFLIYLIIIISFSAVPLLGLYGFAKILEFLFLGIYIARNIKTKNELSAIALIFSFSILAESLLAIVQYIHQSSVGGLLYFLGERKFTASTPGIANASINSELILRAYGTFSHPNVLAGYLLCSLAVIFKFFETGKNNFKKLLKSSALLLGSIALILSLSRIAIIIWAFLVIILVFNSLRKQFINKKSMLIISMFLIFFIISLLVIYTPMLPRLLSSSFTESSFVQRVNLLKSSLAIIQARPFTGTGLCNFIPVLSKIQKPLSPTLYLQPVHNIFLLITAEIGITGLIFISTFLFKTYKHLLKKRNEASFALLIILSTIIIIGQFDHYWLTLQQGQLLLAVIIGLCWAIL